MKLGLLTVLFQDLDFDAMLDRIKGYGFDTIELGTGNFTSDVHCPVDKLLDNDKKINELQKKLQDNLLEISALSCHGNPLHPNKDIASEHHQVWRKTVQLAEQLGVDTVVTFSGCPGSSDNDRYPNWIVCSWPEDHEKALKWQWEEKVIPYWMREAEFAVEHGIKKIAFEMHPNFVVYNPETLLQLREAVGDIIGANFDPSHLIWQGIEPVRAIKLLGNEGALYHFHAKDLFIDRDNVEKNGILDTKGYSDVANRSWTFRTVGYGNSHQCWKDIISMLRTVGYDGTLSIEHEDPLLSVDEGLDKAVEFLLEILFMEEPAKMWWA